MKNKINQRKKKKMKLTANKLKNGALYYNTKSQRVERMLGTLNSNRVWTTSHDATPEANKCNNLRFANGQEVNGYLQASPKWNAMKKEEVERRIAAEGGEKKWLENVCAIGDRQLPPLPTPQQEPIIGFHGVGLPEQQ